MGSSRQDSETIAWAGSRTSFTQIPDWILSHPNISDASLRTWLVLATYTGRNRTVFPGVATVAERRGKSRRQIFEHLEQLEGAGLLRRAARFRRDGGRTSTSYTLAWDGPLDKVRPLCDFPQGGSEDFSTGVHAMDLTGARAVGRTPRTTSNSEQDPQPPPTLTRAGETTTRGARAPRAPAGSAAPRRGRRDDGTNPRAVQQDELRRDGLHRWAQTIMGVAEMTVEDFEEIAMSEVAGGRLTAEDAEIAVSEAKRIRFVVGERIE